MSYIYTAPEEREKETDSNLLIQKSIRANHGHQRGQGPSPREKRTGCIETLSRPDSLPTTLIDEIDDSPSDDSPIIALKHLDDHLLNASIKKTLNRKELKYVSKRILEALKVLHEDGYVHTGMFMYKPLNFLWACSKKKNPCLQMPNLTMSL